MGNKLTAYRLAELLLQGNDLPVVIPYKNTNFDAEGVQNVFLLQKDDSPFEYVIFLEGETAIDKPLINVID